VDIMRELKDFYRAENWLTSRTQGGRFVVGSIELPGTAEPDFAVLFRHVPGIFVVTRPDFTIVAVSDDLLRTTFTWRQDITDRRVFDVFPGKSDGAHGTRMLEECLHNVVTKRAATSLHVLRYDIPDRRSGDDGWVEKFWSVVSRPVIDRRSGEVAYVLTEVRDVTRTVELALWLDADRGLGPEMQRSVQRLRHEVQEQSGDVAALRARIKDEMKLTGATAELLVNELKALLFAPENRLYSCAGEWVTDAGVYVSYHRVGCELAPRVRYLAEGAMFPSCERCGSDVLYRLSHTVPA
jgi:hypothetical protein